MGGNTKEYIETKNTKATFPPDMKGFQKCAGAVLKADCSIWLSYSRAVMFNENTKRMKTSAFMLTLLMIVSTCVAGVAATITDGDGANGVDRNPSQDEQDGATISRIVNPTSLLTSDTLTYGNSPMVQSWGNTTSGNVYSSTDAMPTKWVVAGDGSSATSDHDDKSTGALYSHMNTSMATGFDYLGVVQADATVLTIEHRDEAYSTNADATVKVTMQNWYGSLDRSTAHLVGSAATNSLANTCAIPANEFNELGCNLHGAGGIDADAPTLWNVLQTPGKENTLAFSITGNESTQTKYFGYDVYVPYNSTVYLDGAAKTAGDGYSVNTTSSVSIRCSDTGCTQPDVAMSLPGAYNASNTSEVYNASIRMVIGSPSSGNGAIVKITMGLKSEDQARCAIADGMCILYDPSITFGQDTAEGVRIGQINDGGASWCDAKWFMATCGDTLDFDGNSTNGIDGMMLEYRIPLSVMFSQANWGGYDSVDFTMEHSPLNDRCFNGVISSYVVPSASISNYRSQNSLLTYALKGDYFTVTEPSSQFATGEMSLGTSNADYCTGPSTTNPTTTLSMSAGTILQSLTGTQSLHDSWASGYYDMDEQTFEFTLFVLFTARAPATADAVVDAMSIETSSSSGTGGIGTMVFSNSGSRDPLASSASVVRTTNSTNQTAPNFASPYSLLYSGITPSANNVIAGRNITTGDMGGLYLGLQSDTQETRKPYSYPLVNSKTATNPNGTPMSTIECGLAAFGSSIKSAKIQIYTNTNFDAHFGGGVNGSGIPAQNVAAGNVEGWMPYGTLQSNSSLWTPGTSSGSWAGASCLNPVDYTETNLAGSNAVSYTGSFINNDHYKAICTFEYYSHDDHANNETTVSVVYEFLFDAAHDGNFDGGGGGGSDITTEDEDEMFGDLSWGDLLIMALALLLIGAAIYMWSMGGPMDNWFDARLGMLTFGVGLLTAWSSAQYGGDNTWSEDTALIIGTFGLVLLTAGVYLWAQASTSSADRNIRFALGGLFLLTIGTPAALEGLFGTDSSVLKDMAWEFPAYVAMSVITGVVGFAIFLSSAVGLFMTDRRGGA